MESKMFLLADKLKALRDQKKTIETELDDVKAQIDRIDYELSEYMAGEEIQNFTRDGIMFYLKTDTYASAAAGVKDELFSTLKEQGYGDIVVETVNSRTLSSFVKSLLDENNDELPGWLAGLVNVHEKTGVGVRKAK